MKKLLSMVLATTMIAGIGATAVASMEGNGVYGGWSESGGYYINNDESSVVQNERMVLSAKGTPSATPDSHKGKRLTKIIDTAGTAKYAAHGETVWYHKYHYTTARMESGKGKVLTTSGRQWDDNATRATSPYYLPDMFENTEARTYWGS